MPEHAGTSPNVPVYRRSGAGAEHGEQPPLKGVLLPANVPAPCPPFGVQLRNIAARVVRLSPSHRDPEAYHLEKSEIVADLRRLASEAGRG